MNPPTVALYLRADGSLLLVKSEKTIEMQLTPRQLLELGMDSLRVSLALDPSLGNEVADVLDSTHVLPLEVDPCRLN